MVALEFEKPIAELEGKIAELRNMSSGKDVNIADEISRLENKAEKLKALGVEEVFLPGPSLDTIVSWVREHVHPR